MSCSSKKMLILSDAFNVSIYVSFLVVLSFDWLAETFVDHHDCSATGNMNKDVPKWLFISLTPALFLFLLKYRELFSSVHIDVASDVGEIIDVSLFLVNVIKSQSSFIPSSVFYGVSFFTLTPVVMRGVRCQYPGLVRGTRRHLLSAVATAKWKHSIACVLSFFEVGLHFLGGYAGACLVLDELVDVFWSTEHDSPWLSKHSMQMGMLVASLLLSLLAMEFDAALTSLRFFKGAVGVFYACSITPLSILACLTDMMQPQTFSTQGLPVSLLALSVSSALAVRAGYCHARFPWSERDNRKSVSQSLTQAGEYCHTVFNGSINRLRRKFCESEDESAPLMAA